MSWVLRNEPAIAKWEEVWGKDISCSLLTLLPWKVLLSFSCVSEDPLFLTTKKIKFMFVQLSLEQHRFELWGPLKCQVISVD